MDLITEAWLAKRGFVQGPNPWNWRKPTPGEHYIDGIHAVGFLQLLPEADASDQPAWVAEIHSGMCEADGTVLSESGIRLHRYFRTIADAELLFEALGIESGEA